MPPQLSKHDRRVLLVGLVCIAALLLASRGIPAWRSWQSEKRAAASKLASEVARSERSVRMRRALADSLERRGARLLALAPALLNGETPAAAAGTLAGLISGAAATSGVRLGAVQVRPAATAPGAFARVAVRANAIGDVRGLVELLATLERGPTMLVVRELAVAQPEPATPAEAAEALRFEFVVEGLALKPRHSSTSSTRSPNAGRVGGEFHGTGLKRGGAW
jgi:Type II secretion system (T2SS), protein M subtype b